MNVSKNTKLVRVINATAAGTSAVNSSSVDTKGFRGCRFIVGFGAIVASAVTSIKVQQSSDDGSADAFADLTGTGVTIADTDDNKIAYVDVYAPRERYLRCVVSRGTANATVDFGICELYDPAKAPTTDDATTVVTSELHTAPAEGTA